MNTSFDSSDDGSARGELFTPVRGGRKSLMVDFSPTPSRSTTSEETTPAPKAMDKNSGRNTTAKDNNINNSRSASFFADDTPNTLPKLHDTSWLGSGMSPIRNERNDLLESSNNEDEDAAVVAPYRLGLTETSGSSSVAATESFFLSPNRGMDDIEGNISKERTPANVISGNRVGISSNQNSTIHARGASSKGYIRPRPPHLLHPPTSATSNNGGGLGTAREQDKYDNHRRRRRLMSPFQRKFWTFWSALTSSSSENGLSSSFAMVDDPSRLATNGRAMAGIGRCNLFVIGATAFLLFCVGIHDAFLAYLAMRRGLTDSEQHYGLAWTLPWIGPTQRSLLRFGAFCPEYLLPTSSLFTSSPPYWRLLTSMVVPISLVEWMLLVWVWTRYIPSSPFAPATNVSWHLSRPVVYLLSACTGQLWMMAYYCENLSMAVAAQDANASANSNYNSSAAYDGSSLPALSGCAGWATAGVLCAVGIQSPNRRFPCFLSSIALVILHQCQTTGSVMGCASASFFGWAYMGFWSPPTRGGSGASALSPMTKRVEQQRREMLHHEYAYYHEVLHDGGTAMDESRRWSLWHILAAMVVFLLWFSPIMFLLYR